MTWGIFKDIFKHLCISGLLTVESKTSCCEEEFGGAAYQGFFFFCFVLWWCGSPLSVKVMHMQRCVSKRSGYILEYIFICVCVKREKREKRVTCVENEWEEGARLVYRFRSTFSWKEDPCCFPLWPFLTVWIHYAFRGALVQKSAPNPPAPLPTHQLGLHLLFWPFLCGGSDIKVDPRLVPL